MAARRSRPDWAAQGNVILTQINGAASGLALVGGGGAAGTKTISILPWALGDTSNIATAPGKYSTGSGFVTYDTNGVRLLSVGEYNTSNDVSNAGTTENMRISASHALTTSKAVNSMFFSTSGATISGSPNGLTITSGALASNVATAIISAPVNFGAGGSGEAIVSVVDALNGNNAITLSGTVMASSLVKSGQGRLVLNTGTKTITNGITINGGAVEVPAISQLGGATSLTFNSPSYSNGARLTYTGSGSDILAATVPVAVNSGAAGFNVSNLAGTLNLNSSISGAGGIRKDGSGTLILGGTNSYSGGTFIGLGTLEINSDARLGSSADPKASFLELAGGTLRLSGAWSSARAIRVDAGTLNTQANTATLSGPITGSGNLTKLGSGTLAISGADNGYAGTITLGVGGANPTQGGTLALSDAGALNSASVTFGASGAPSGNYILDLSGATGSGTPWRSLVAMTTGTSFTQAHEVKLGASAGTPVDLRVASGTFGQGTSPNGTGVITGFGKLIKVGSGTLTLFNPNTTSNSTFTGGIEIWGGTLRFNADNQLGDSSNGITFRGGVLYSTANVATSRAITLGPTPQPIYYAGSLISDPLIQRLVNTFRILTGTTLTLNGPISGPGGLAVGVDGFTDSGTLILGAPSNNYAGDTQLGFFGSLAFTDNAQLGAASSRLRMGRGTLSLTAAPGGATTYTVPRTVIFTFNGGTMNVANALATLELSGPLVGLGTMTKTGSGQLTISGSNPSWFGGLTIGDAINATGNVTLASTGQLRRSTLILSANSGATFDMSGLTREFGSLGSNGVNTFATGTTVALGNGGILTTGFSNLAMNWLGNITGNSAASVTKVGTNTLSVQGNGNTFGGGFHLLSGDGTVNSNGTLPAQTAFTIGGWGTTVNAGGKLSLDNSLTVANRIADSQVIHSNSGELVYFDSTASSETAGSLRGAGQTTVTISTGGTLSFADASNGLTRLDRGTFLLRAGNANLGTAAATTTIGNLLFANLPGSQLIGGGGGPGARTISILPYAVGGIATTDTGSSFVTYGANGVRVLNTTTEVNVSLTGAAANENVRLANGSLTTTQLGSGTDKTVNSLNIAGPASTTRIESAAAEKLILDSGALLNTASNLFTTNTAGTMGVPLGIQTAELQTGSSNTRELNVFTTSGDLAIGAKVTTSGGLTKSGAANLYLTNSANTYTGQTTINAGNLVIDDKLALGGSTNLVIGGGFLKYRGTDTTLTGFTVKAAGGAGAGLGASAGFQVVSGTTLTLPGAAVSGNGGIMKDCTGVLKLTGANTYSGATIISGGALAITQPEALGTNGRVIFADGAISGNGGQTLRFDAPMTLTQDFITNTAASGVGFGFDTNGNNVTLSGTMLGFTQRGLYKFGAGELNLTATETYTGSTQIFGGSLRLSGANGSIVNSADTGLTAAGGFVGEATVFAGPGTSLVLDNSATNNNNRLPDVWDTPFGSGNGPNGKVWLFGSELRIIGNASGTSERINQLDFSFGTVTLQGGGTVLTSGAVGRVATPQAGGLIRGTNLGGTPGLGSTNWFVTDLGSGGVALGGAGGAKGTPFINLFAGFVGDTSATGNGTDFVTYAADVGFRTLTAGEYTSTIPVGNFDLNRAPNVSLTGPASVNQTTAITALKLGPGASVSGSGTLLLGQGTVLATGNPTIDVPSLSINVNGAISALVIQTPNALDTLTVSSVLPGGASLALLKYGAGTLALSGRQLGDGFIHVAKGKLRLDGATDSLNPLGTGINVQPGAIFDLGGSDRVISRLEDRLAIGVGTALNGTIALGANRLTLYSNAFSLYSGNITGTGGLTTAFNSGTTVFTRPLSYTGSTIIRGGYLQLTDGGTLATSAVEARGGTLVFDNRDGAAAASGYVANRLGTSTPITLAGGEVNFIENPNTPANHSLGPITLAGGGKLSVFYGSAAPSTVTVSNLIRNAGSTLTVDAGNVGLAQSPTGNARVFLTQINGGSPTAALIGGNGALGSTTQSILPWAWDSSNDTFLTYGTNGLRSLAVSEFETNLNLPSSASANIRTTGDVALTAPRTVNSLLNTFGTLSGAFDLTLGSGVLAGGGLIGTNTNALLTGAGNTRELVLQTRFVTTLGYNLTTIGGVTKFGLNPLTLTGTNTFTGGFNINEGRVNFDADRQLGAAGGVIRFGGANGSSSLVYGGVLNAPFAFNRAIETTSFGTLTNLSTDRWQLNQPITGAGGIGYGASSSVFEINAVNSYTGATNWSGGHLYITDDSAFGSGGELLLGTNGVTSNIVLRGNWTSGRLLHAAGTGAIQTNGYDATWGGQLIGGSTLVKNGTGSLVLTEAMPYSGALTVNAGTVRLTDRGSIAGNASTHTVNAGAALALDDTGVHSSDRLHDSGGGVTLAGGEFRLLGSNGSTTEEVFNVLALEAGAGTVTVAAGTAQAGIVRLAGPPTNAIGAASLWRGSNLGVNTPGTADSANVLLTPTNTAAFPLTGGSAPVGTPSISIIRGGFGDTSATGLGTQLVTYDLDKGVRLLNPNTEYTTTLVNGSVVTDNVKADASSLALANATTANALWLKDGASITGAGTLTLSAGSILATGPGNTVAKTINAGANALAIGGPGDLTFNSAVTSTTTGGLIKMGAGTLTLNTANSYTGTTVIAAGTVALGNASAFASTAVLLQGGEIRNTSGAPLTLANNLTLNGTMNVGGAQDLMFSGTVSLNNATRTLNVTNSATTTISGVISSSQLLINYGLTKTGPGLLVLSNAANAYDGETTVASGELRISGSIAASTLTTVAGGTLSGNGTVGALRTTGGTLAPGTSVGTLNSGSVTFSGGTFSIEISSASLADKLMVTGTAGLAANTALTLSLLGGYTPTGIETWTIIDNDAADAFTLGTFRFTNAGNPINPLVPFTAGGVGYYLDYAGGTSANDVVLHVVPEPAIVALLAAAHPLIALRRRR
ncbi:MAG: fibronectin-binding autotransporter adhesin [Chthoniobacter sp.]|nr:fibronectin-binding autotransporter adhesin [Chthoniobacter sp.]